MMKKFLWTATFVLLTFSQIAAAQKIVSCDIYAAINNRPEDYTGSLGGAITTTDRTGTNIRKGPGTSFAVLKTLKDRDGFWFHITASSGSWVRIDSFYEVGRQTNAYEGETPFDGWIYAPSLFLKAEPRDAVDVPKAVYNLYAAPDMKSSLLFRKNELRTVIANLQGCRGEWAKVSYQGKIGWLNPYTQCHDLWTEMCAEGED